MTRQNMTKLYPLTLVLLIALCMTGAVSVGEAQRNVCTIAVGDGVLSVFKNGKELQTYAIDAQKQVTFHIEGDYEVAWDQATSTAYAKESLRISSAADREQKVDAALWQLSAEARACFWQSFNVATLRFNQALEANASGETLAVIADIDDTLVDGVMYTADVLQDGEWTNAAFRDSLASEACRPLPGAVEFMNYVVDKGGVVFYVTNRDPSLREVTYSSMARMGFPMVDMDHIHIRETGMASSKESRRANIEKDYEVVLILGDNLEDFADLFPVKDGNDVRRNAVDDIRDEWGRRFIMFPNAVYGDWEKAIYRYDRTKTPAQRMADKISTFDQYKYTR